ncbi:MAG: hypothetical protein ACQEP1_01685 [Nanobdellota archaeon]
MVEDPRKRLIYKSNVYFRVKDVNVFNLKAFYTMLHEWFVEEEFCGDEDKFPEVYQRDRNSQKRGRELIIHWRFSKEPGGVKFYQRRYDVLIKAVGIKDAEVAQEGKKFKVQKGTIEVKVWGYLEYDAEMKWRNNWLLKHFLDLYVKRINAKDMDANRNLLIEEAETLQGIIKDYLNLLKYDDKSPDINQVHGPSDHYQ